MRTNSRKTLKIKSLLKRSKNVTPIFSGGEAGAFWKSYSQIYRRVTRPLMSPSVSSSVNISNPIIIMSFGIETFVRT